MKEVFDRNAAMLGQLLGQRRRGFDLFLKEVFSTFSRAYDEDTATVYVSGYAFPTELLWAFDVVPFDFEIACNNHPAVLQNNGSSIMKEAEKIGYSTNVCSFDRLILGCMLKGMLPKGALYLTSSYYCHGKAKANEIVASNDGKESVLFDVPNEISPASKRYVTSQLQDIASKLEDVTGDALDMDRLSKAIRWSNCARSSMARANEFMKAKPFPYDGVKACTLGLMGGLFWGNPIMDEVYGLICREMEERIDKGTAFPERFRVLWYPWVPVQGTRIFSTLKKMQVSVVMVEAARVWWSEMDENKPFEALALKALQNHHLGPCDGRVEALIELAKSYDVDGVIHFQTPACHGENASIRIVSDAMKKKGLPVLDLDGDMSDERGYSEKRTDEKLNTFYELLQSHAAA